MSATELIRKLEDIGRTWEAHLEHGVPGADDAEFYGFLYCLKQVSLLVGVESGFLKERENGEHIEKIDESILPI